jgi:hypothetical protein
MFWRSPKNRMLARNALALLLATAPATATTDAFAHLAACADNELGRLVAIVDRLWRRAERCKRIDDGPFADRRYARDVNLPDEAHAVFQFDVGTDYTIRADLDAVPNAGTVGDARRCINRHVLTDPTAAWY